MTFNAQETSLQGGSPVELYEFVRGPTTFRFTSQDRDYTFETKVYTAATLVRAEIEDSGELPRSNLKVTAALDFPVADLFRLEPPGDVVTLKILRVHRTDGALEAKTLWIGRVLNAEWQGARVELFCESIFTALRRPGLRRLYGRACPHVLYSGPCGVNDLAYKETVVLTGVAGGTLTAAEFGTHPDGYYSGGYIRWERETGVYERRSIRSHVAYDIGLIYPVDGLGVGSTVDVFPGCDHSLATCGSKFSNTANFGGFPYVPKLNPFGGGLIY